MSQSPLDKAYNPAKVESRWGAYWIEHQLFRPTASTSLPHYSIVIPPPNVTGSLHIGHALNNTLQDILIRWRRMQGYRTRWIPGTDHAGIATQNVVERQLAQEGTSREAMGREAFIKRVWQWRQHSGDTIIGQLKQLGASCDWSRIFFTMDQDLSVAVREVFVQLYQEGLIYRGERLINWCPRCLTALSDIEVEHEQVKGKLYFIRYPLTDHSDQYLVVATTRPETLLGDTAVAVHPEDPRYQEFINSMVALPLTQRTIPIVGDSILVDREFGTGAVKITPAHDFNDFEAGERHSLPRLPLLDHQGRMSPLGLQTADVEPSLVQALYGKTALEARPIVIQHLEEKDFLIKAEDHQMAVGKCYRCKTTVEPYLSPQWFVKIQPLADPAIEAVESEKIRIHPEGWKNNYLGWMKQIKDWCISRQIWWGHQIPAWYCRTCNKEHLLESGHAVGATAEDGPMPAFTKMSCLISSEAVPIVSRSTPSTCPICGGDTFLQDPDVLDTWFSSALWPFSTLGWPKDSEALKEFYPTSTLVTGLDILFFWVARMIMMGIKFTGQPPFRDVYIHALVRDAEGQKMSKSKGNVIDPLTKMSQYGTDALRFTLASMASPGRDIRLAEERIEGYRNFVTKLWNAARFIQLHTTDIEVKEFIPLSDRFIPDRWIFSRLNRTIGTVNNSLEEFRFDQAASHLYQFIWHEYCDWYIELAKTSLKEPDEADAPSTRQTMLETFEIIQRLLHPIMPFITEELWQTFPHQGQSIVTQPFPTENPDLVNQEAEEVIQHIQSFVTMGRTARSLLNISASQTSFVYANLTNIGDKDKATFESLRDYIESLLRSPVEINALTPHRTLQLPAGYGITIGIQVPKEVDIPLVISKIQKRHGEIEKEIQRLKNRLSSTEFREKAEPSIIQESETRRKQLNDERDILDIARQQLNSMMS